MMVLLILLGLTVVVLLSGLFTVPQGSIAVVTMFGKYRRIADPGLSIRIPFFETVARRISIQNRTVEMAFQAITRDQANVYFKSMMLYSVMNHSEETIKRVAFKFINQEAFIQALSRTVEGMVRAFVASKRQAEILSVQQEIVEAVKLKIDRTLEEWGFHLLDLQINDITFDKVIMDSMSQVVASKNLKEAAENEGQALLITKTKAAEADAVSIKISAEAEREAARMRGQSVAFFRSEVAAGMKRAALEMNEANLDTHVILFSMWTEALKNVAELNKGGAIFLDGSVQGFQQTVKQLMALQLQPQTPSS
ncbi:MAG: SPFH domain-containing protein [Verrucomicrobiota bacterium]|nr:SPFH domain-containing protein [Verrucomicrobiota bacterium]